ncbi:MAG: ATPase domain-containing protein [Methanocorpusculum sp.]|nr:ATPase domain-containing protein [Methanocorpusculum sp.]
MADAERVPTGVPGLDEMIGGGLAKNQLSAVIGQVGTGRTMFTFQFLHEGLIRGEKCIFISLYESTDYLAAKFVKRFPDSADKIDKDMFFVRIMPENLLIFSDEIGGNITDMFQELGVNRVVVDPFSMFEDMIISRDGFRASDMHRVYSSFRTSNATTLLVTQSSLSDPLQSKYGYAEVFADNVACLFRYFPDNNYMKPYKLIFLILKLSGKIEKTARYVKYTNSGLFTLVDSFEHTKQSNIENAKTE